MGKKKKYRHKPTEVWARKAEGVEVHKTAHGGKIVLHEEDGDMVIYGQHGEWGNTRAEFDENYEEVDE